jgi:hypothetical protein
VEYDNIQLTAPTNLDLLADAALQPVSTIRDLNPELLTTLAPAGFQIHVPKGTAQTALAALEAVPAPNRNAWRLHHVTAGDTLSTIAVAYHTTTDRIVAANTSTDSLETGDLLLIPAAYHAPAPAYGRNHPVRRTSLLGAGAGQTHKTQTRTSQARTKLVTARHLSSPALHRKAVVSTASLQH